MSCIAGYTLVSPESVTNIATIPDTRNITTATSVYIDSSARTETGDVIRRTFFPLKDLTYRQSILPAMIRYVYFLKFGLANQADTAITVFLRPGNFFSSFHLFKQGPTGERIQEQYIQAGYGKITLAPHEQTMMIAYLRPAKAENISINPVLIAGGFLEHYKLAMQGYHPEIKTTGYVFSGVLLMMILFMSTNFIISRKKEFETQIAMLKVQQEERNRISTDMHDDLGAGMTTIRLYSELARKRIGDLVIPEIDKISASADELLDKMNAIIWSMSSSNDTLNNLTAYIRSYALEYFENTGITCRISLPEHLPNIEVNGEIRRNIFLVVKEALNNIVKHSGATLVEITLMRVPGGLTLLIHDNGKGINFEELRQFGNGLKNMKKRIEEVGIEFHISVQNGTLISLHRNINLPCLV